MRWVSLSPTSEVEKHPGTFVFVTGIPIFQRSRCRASSSRRGVTTCGGKTVINIPQVHGGSSDLHDWNTKFYDNTKRMNMNKNFGKRMECEDSFFHTMSIPATASFLCFSIMRVIFKRLWTFHVSRNAVLFASKKILLCMNVWSFKPCRKTIIKRHRDSVLIRCFRWPEAGVILKKGKKLSKLGAFGGTAHRDQKVSISKLQCMANGMVSNVLLPRLRKVDWAENFDEKSRLLSKWGMWSTQKLLKHSKASALQCEPKQKLGATLNVKKVCVCVCVCVSRGFAFGAALDLSDPTRPKKSIFNLGGGFKDFWNFYPDPWGDDPIWRAYFSKGLVQPPTSYPFW